jgi:peptidoglycan/LPS O-acetylase OafA/YrhL
VTDEERFLKSGDESGTVPGDRKFRSDVEGMRAVAILLVLFCHFWIPGFIGGGVGVDVFFVVSGFVITGALLRERDSTGHTSFLNFYARRGRRIIPVAMLVVIVTLVLERVIAGQAFTATLADPTRWVVFFAFNLDQTALRDEIFRTQPFAPYWSLAVEEQFYLVYPALILATFAVVRKVSWRFKVDVVLCGAVAASLTWSVLSSGPYAFDLIPYNSSLTRAWELAVGCLIAWNMPLTRRIPTWLAGAMTWGGLGLVVVSGLIVKATTPYPGWRVVLPVAGTALVIIGGTPEPRWGAERVLGMRPVRAVGRWSYGIYLWEIPLLALAVHWWGPLNVVSLWGRVGLILVTMVIAAASYRFFESPIRHSARLTASPALSLACAAAFMVVALATISLVAL